MTAVERTEDAIGRELLEIPDAIEESQAEPLATGSLAASGGVAIAGVTPSTLEPADETPAVSEAPAPELEKRAEDLPIALMAAVLAFSVFLPWYKAPQGVASAAGALTGWATGTWGPLILFLSGGALALVALRRLGMRVALPYPETIVLEAIGWVSTLTAILKARFRPEYAEGLKVGLDNRIWVAVGAGLALALLAGRASGKTPFVAVPGWYRGKAGKLGLVLLAVMVAGGVAFGLTNGYNPKTSASPVRPGAQGTPNTVKGRLPDCATGFPIPATVKPYSGQNTPGTSTCVALLTSTGKAQDVSKSFQDTLKKAGYKFAVKPGVNGATVITLTGPKCGTLQIVAIAQTPSTKEIGNTFASLILTPCTQASPR